MSEWAEVVPFGGVGQPDPAKARATIIPVPLEGTVSFGRGTSLGPAALMWASAYMELYDELLDCEPIDLGILTRPMVDVNGDQEEVIARTAAAVAEELDAGRLPAVVGGEHTVTLGPLRALLTRRGADFTVLVLDAHLDLREEFEGTPYSHACVAHRALDLGLAVRHLGIRSCSLEEARLVKARNLPVVWDHQVQSDPAWLDRALAGLAGPVYLSLDVDGLAPGVLSATGTPEPGGLSWQQASRWLQAVCARHPVVGLDVVELAPQNGHCSSEFTAARLLYRALGLALLGPRP